MRFASLVISNILFGTHLVEAMSVRDGKCKRAVFWQGRLVEEKAVLLGDKSAAIWMLTLIHWLWDE